MLFVSCRKTSNPHSALYSFEVQAKALKGVELAQRLTSCLAVKYNFGPNTIIGRIRDGALVNGAALRQLKFFYSNLFDIVCFSHTIDTVGNHFEFRILDSFTQYWVSLFAHSFNARLLWKEKTGQAMRTHSDTRWWSKWDILQQALYYFGDIEPFLRENEELSPAVVDIYWKSLMIIKISKTYVLSLLQL